MEFFQGDDDVPTKVLDYRQLLSQQAWTTSMYLNQAHTKEQLVWAENAVTVLEALMVAQTKDSRYQKHIRDLMISHRNMFGAMSPRVRRSSYIHMKRKFVMTKFRLLLDLMSRVGLSYIPEVSVIVGDDNSKSVRVKPIKKVKPILV